MGADPGSGRLTDKVAIVTGTDSGIARAGAALFARKGADIIVTCLCEHDDAEKRHIYDIVQDHDYFDRRVRPELDGTQICYHGPVAGAQRARALGRSIALCFI